MSCNLRPIGHKRESSRIPLSGRPTFFARNACTSPKSAPGNHPEGDIEIHFTGLRPAEKLCEELLIGKNVTGTEHPRISRAMDPSLTWEQIRQVLDSLAQCSIRFDCGRAREILIHAVPEYRPTERVQDHVWLQGGQRVSGAVLSDDEKVRELRPRPPA